MERILRINLVLDRLILYKNEISSGLIDRQPSVNDSVFEIQSHLTGTKLRMDEGVWS